MRTPSQLGGEGALNTGGFSISPGKDAGLLWRATFLLTQGVLKQGAVFLPGFLPFRGSKLRMRRSFKISLGSLIGDGPF